MSIESDPRFDATVYVVEAGDYESLALWRENETSKEMTWVQDNHGFGITIGRFGKMPVCVSVMWVMLNGKRVAFIDPTSQVVDWRMIDKWMKSAFPNSKGRANAMNFGHCIEAVKP